MGNKCYSSPNSGEEERRLSALDAYRLLDTPPTADFDRLAKLAARLFEVPVALISLVAADGQFFKAHIGLDICETSREVSFCAHAIDQDGVLFIPDTLKDSRFSTNPLVLGKPFIRFYAGHPLITPGGEKLGTICVIDSKPRQGFDARQRRLLADLAELVMDRMELYRLDFARKISQTRFENIAATSPDAIICSDNMGRVTFWNRSAERLFGYSAAEISHLPSSIIVPIGGLATYAAELGKLQEGKEAQFTNKTISTRAKRRDGSEFPADISFSTWKEGSATSVGAIVRDVTERRKNEERLYHLATRDPLTDLPNRGAWRECLAEALQQAKPVTVLLLDLDGFKEINDTYGHLAGDAALKQVAVRLTADFDDAIMLARLGGDEFVVLMPGNDERTARAIAERLITVVSAPYEYGEGKIEIRASVGVSVGPTHGLAPDTLLGAADLALYKAKNAGKARYEMFTPAIREVAVARRAFEHELKSAFEVGEFELFYQPQVDTRTREVLGAEALIRWHHPTRGLLTPASFIEVLSNKPSAAKVGEWILNQACKDAKSWRDALPNFRISVNLFEAQFRAGNLMSIVRDALDANQMPGSSLELEIVENIVMRNDPATLDLLHNLRGLGVGLALDDYGTGYASLSLLKEYPVSRLKIDKSFIRDVTSDHEDAAVVQAIIYLGTSFHLEVIAEGVETEAQAQYLARNGCHQAQGYLFGRPMPARSLSSLVLKNRGNGLMLE